MTPRQSSVATTGRRSGIKDVALRAGVSVGTVSNVLNRPEAVAAATRQRVEQAIADLKFIRNASARHLRAGQSLTVGAIVLDIGNPFYTELARGIEDRLAEDNCTLMLCSSDENAEREARFLTLFAEQDVRGVLVTPSQGTETNLARLRDMGIDAVLLDAHSETFPSVGVDDVAGGRAAVSHLIEQGHDRLGFVNGPMTLDQCRGRRDGALQAIREFGGTQQLIELNVEHMSADAGQVACQQLLASAETAPTAIFCVNDIVALGVMRELRLRNIDIGPEMAVVGYDDISFASELMTPLSSVRQPMREIGRTATDMLLNPGSGDQHVVFAPKLIVRESSGHTVSVQGK